MITRRRFLQATAIGLASAATVRLARAAPRRVRLTRHRVPWAGDARLRLAHLTDIHLGWGTPPHLLREGLRLCREARPDLVVLTGDYVNRSLDHLPALRRWLRELPRPCVATLGNHDHWSGAAEVTGALQREGVIVLSNAHTTLRLGAIRVPLVGVDDGFTDHADVPRAFAGLARPERALVLSHFPDAADEVARHGGRLVLAGHTHGGQIRVPIVTPAVARLAGNRYIAGWYHLGSTRLYVNAGIGSALIRLRLGREAAPEVAIIDLLPLSERQSDSGRTGRQMSSTNFPSG